jgi:hypothetical protein
MALRVFSDGKAATESARAAATKAAEKRIVIKLEGGTRTSVTKQSGTHHLYMVLVCLYNGTKVRYTFQEQYRS